VKLQVHEAPDRDGIRRITNALLQADVGGRINFDATALLVRLESRLTVDQAIEAIARSGYQVASVVDATISDRRP
jgi:hypothetical protein